MKMFVKSFIHNRNLSRALLSIVPKLEASDRQLRSFFKCTAYYNQIGLTNHQYFKSSSPESKLNGPDEFCNQTEMTNNKYLNKEINDDSIDQVRQPSDSQLTTNQFNFETNVQQINHNQNSNLSNFDNYLANSRGFDPNATHVSREYIQTIRPELPITFNLATYANRLDIIRQLVKLNVRLCDIEKNRDLTQYLLTLDFDKDVIPHLNFLVRCGLEREDIGNFLSVNFGFLRENIENLEKRIAYYKRMGFNRNEICEIMISDPKFINYPIDYVDEMLGYIQQNLRIDPKNVRKMLYRCSRILKVKQYKTNLEEKKFVLYEQCGFESRQIKKILINTPKILIRDPIRIANSFEYVYKNITQDYDLIGKFSEILCINVKRLEERDLYLKRIGRAQYDPLKPLYVPLYAFIILEDEIFLKQFCKTSQDDFYKFIKTM